MRYNNSQLEFFSLFTNLIFIIIANIIKKRMFIHVESLMNLPSPRPNTNLGKLVAFLREHPNERFSDSELAEKTKLPKVTASNARIHGYVYRDEDGLYYLPSEDDSISTQVPDTSSNSTTQMSEELENKLIKQAIRKKIEEHQRQIELLKDLFKSY